MARLGLLIGVGLLMGFSQFSCSSGGTGRVIGGDDRPDNGSGNGPTFTSSLVLRNSAGVESYRFDSGETIRMDLSVRNRSAQTVHVQFRSAQQTDFVVIDDGGSTVRWRWSDGRMFAQVSSELTFDAFETKIFTVDWDQVTASGALLSRGHYEARGVLLFEEFAANPLAPHEQGSPLRPFEVR